MYAIVQEIPVVTLDNCEDEAFMEKRKEACHQKAEEIFAVDEKENCRKLCEFVEAYTLEQEKQADSR